MYRDAGFTGNAEETVFERFKPHLGGIRLLKVQFNIPLLCSVCVYFQEQEKSIRDVILWFVNNFGPKDQLNSEPELRNDLALDITFGSIGYSLILARGFVKVHTFLYVQLELWNANFFPGFFSSIPASLPEHQQKPHSEG